MKSPTVARRVAVPAACMLAAMLLPFMLPNYGAFQLTLVCSYAIAIMGLNILTGFNKQISLGHGAFFALGAYTAAVLMDRFNAPYWTTLPAASIVCFILGLVVGFPALRLSGHSLALATFALAMAMPQILKHKSVEEWTGGVQGISLAKPEVPFSAHFFGVELSSDRWLYLVALAVTAAMYWLAMNLLKSRAGRAWIAIGDHPVAAATMGINLPLYKSVAFGVSAAYAGVAGALSAISVAFVSPDSFNVSLSVFLLVGLVVGGLRSLSGAIPGALFIQFVPNIADHLSKSAPAAVYGIVLIALMYFIPEGIMSLIPRATRFIRSKNVFQTISIDCDRAGRAKLSEKPVD